MRVCHDGGMPSQAHFPADQSPTAHPPAAETLLVACLCAQWCGACREYQPLFEQLQAEFGGVRFRWIDVEDESDVVDPVEVENFPTVLLAQGTKPVFFGTITPHLETLRRLIQHHLDTPQAAGLQAADIVQLARNMSG
jgi:thioredoxin 1